MRFLSYRSAMGGASFGVIEGDAAFDLAAASGVGTLAAFVGLAPAAQARAMALARRGAALPLAGVHYLPVIPQPGKMVCLGLNYAEHAREGGHEPPTYPALFMRGAASLVGNGEPLIRPLCSDKLDYEAELAVVIGRRARHLAEARAFEAVAGYTVFNDGSVRDYQRRGAQWTPGKNFDATGVLGPVLVTPDELPSGAAGLHIESRLNGRVMQSSTTADMIFGVAKTIEILTEFMTLEPGDVIAMGTPPGVGHARKPPVFMRHGDICEIAIEGIGVLRNEVRDEVLSPVEVLA